MRARSGDPGPTDRWLRRGLAATLALVALQFLLTARWADVDGSFHGPKRPFFVAAFLLVSAALAWSWRRPPRPILSRRAAALVAAGGAAWLAAAWIVWFPPATWTSIPFLDNWPPRYQATLDFIALLDRGVVAGWQWQFLGGYHTTSDITQHHGVLAWLPVRLLGEAAGFHALHALLFLAVPVLVWRDLSLEPGRGRLALVAAGLAAVTASGYAYFLLRSGDTNSLAGTVLALAALVGAHAARAGRRWGGPVLVTGLVLTHYAHAGFLAYAAGFLALDAAVARDRRSARRGAGALVVALVAGLPLTWELWRYPAWFSFNNIVYDPATPIDWGATARKVYYNVELLFRPGRWFNDYVGLAWALLPAAAAVAWLDRSRVRFHALALLATTAVTSLDVPAAGYVFARPIHFFPVFAAPILALFVAERAASAALAWGLVACATLYVQVWWRPVPHVPSVTAFDAGLVERVRTAGGALVLVENNPHRNMRAPSPRLEPSRFGVHFEPLLAAATGRRLYAGYWDGWQWNPWRGRTVAGGTFMGRGLPDTPHDAFVDELTRWGVVDLFVWSGTTTQYLDADARFEAVWRDAGWTQYRLAGADGREVVTATGAGAIEARDWTGAVVALTGVSRGDPVVVRTSFHPAWQAGGPEGAVPLRDAAGQLGFAAPCDGDCRVVLAYPRRAGLTALGAGVWAVAVAAALRRGRRIRRQPD